MSFQLDQSQMYELKTRIDEVKKLDNMKYLSDISKIIVPNRQGIKRLNSLSEEQYLELTQYLDNVEEKYKNDFFID